MSTSKGVDKILSGFGRPRITKPTAKRNTTGPVSYKPVSAESITTASKPATSPKGEPLAYFDSNRGQFWHKNSRGEWIKFGESSVRRSLKYETYRDEPNPEVQRRLIDQHLMTLQREHDVSYAGAIAGFKIGVHEVCGRRILITNGPRLLTRKEGTWATFRRFVETLLGEHVRVFYGWIRSALISLYSGPPFRPGQMLSLAGPAGCGKSLLQAIITELLGGRATSPYRYMIGETSHNLDLIESEHLMIEDQAASTDLRIRRTFGSMVKNLLVNESQSLHPKGVDAIPVKPFCRVTLSVNDEPENLMVLPPLDHSLQDKISLLRCHPFKVPYAVDDIKARNAWRAKLSAELPAFMHWLRSWRVPAWMVDVRYGVKAFQDATLCQELEDLSPEAKLMRFIDTLQIWNVDRDPWVGTAADLEDVLLEKDKNHRVDKLLCYNTACGTYLGRLKDRFPERIQAMKMDGSTRKWRITLPPK